MKILFDMLFIIISTIALFFLMRYGLFEKLKGYVLIPFLVAYYLGQFVERKFNKKTQNEPEWTK